MPQRSPHAQYMQACLEIYQGQYRTKSVWRLCTPSACKFLVIFHKNAREYIQYSLRFLFHLTKNLTTHLSHNLCAVLPKGILCKSLVRCCPEIFECLLHAFYNMPQKFVKHFRMFVAFGLAVYNFYIVSSLELSEIHNTYAIFTKNKLIFLTKYFLRSD